MANFWKFNGSEERRYPSYQLTADPGFVYDFGAGTVPNDGRWVSDPGPATAPPPPVLPNVPAAHPSDGDVPVWDSASASYKASSASVFVRATVVMMGAGIDPTGATDSTAAIQAKLDSIPASGGDVIFPAGTFAVSTLTANHPVTIRGAGGALIGDGGLSPIRAATTLVSTSATADCLVLNAIGSSVRDLAIVNESATTPTAGDGIHLAAGSQAAMSRVTVLGFWNNVEVSGVYWMIEACHLYDPVNNGVYVNAQGANYQDHADAGIVNTAISMFYRTYNATAAIRWRAGGGGRIIGNKINGAAQPGNSAGKFAYGIDLNADTNPIVDFNIIGNSIANFTANAIRVTQTGNGQVGWVNINSNQINVGLGASSVGVWVGAVDDTHVNNIKQVVISGNNFESLQGGSIQIGRGKFIHVGANLHSSVTGTLVALSVGGGAYNSAIQGVSVESQSVGDYNSTVIEDWRDYSQLSTDGLVAHRYDRPLHITTVNTDVLPWTVTVSRNGAATLFVSITGYNWSSGRNFVIEQRRALTRTGTGAVTVATIGTDVAVGTAAPDLTVTYDTTTSTGDVIVKVRATNATYPNVDGRCRMELAGIVNKVVKGAS